MKRIRDPIYGYITLDDESLKIVDNPFFQRLRYIKQNGLAYLVFPSATHTRFEHSLGTYHVASLMVKKVKAKIDEELIKKVALLHDIGHMPFSHTFEQALEILRVMDQHKYLELLDKIVKPIQQSTGLKLLGKFHEYMGIFIVDKCMGLREVAEKMKEIYINKVSSIEESIISSTLDADRLDFLQRDSYYFGVKYGLIPFDRLLDVMEINEDGKYEFDIKGRDDLEHFLVARYHMYSAVYNHPVKQIMDSIMAYTIARMISDGVVELEMLTECDKILNFTDDYIIMKLKENSSRYKHLYEAIYLRRKYKKIILEDQDADSFNSQYMSKKLDELYEFIIQNEGKLVISSSKTDMPVDNIVLKIGGNKIDLGLIEPSKYINIPMPRFKVSIGYYEDSVLKEFENRFPIKKTE